jgi:hypothetical protein
VYQVDLYRVSVDYLEAVCKQILTCSFSTCLALVAGLLKFKINVTLRQNSVVAFFPEVFADNQAIKSQM